MKELVVFVTHHWVLSALLGVALFAFIVNEMIGSRLSAKHAVSPERAVQLINHQEAIVFDIRTEAAFLAGHIVNSEHVTTLSLDKKMNHLQKHLKKPIIIATAIGQDTSNMLTLLQKKGFSEMFMLSGGIQAWQSAGMPLVKS